MSEYVFMLLALLVFVAVLLAVYNNNAVIKRYKITSGKVRGKLTVVVIADLHNKKYNPANSYLIDKVKKCAPDIIVIAGDFVDAGRTDYLTARRTLDGLRRVADVYYVSGNHEAILGIDKVTDTLDCRDIFIDDEYRIFKNYSILGISDSEANAGKKRGDVLSVFEQLGNFKIAVCHRPYEFENGLELCKNDIDLVISGHEHGGVMRIPFFGALLTHDGFFPKYSKGMYTENGTVMIVSGGVGNTVLPLRINNFPEIVKIDIEEN